MKKRLLTLVISLSLITQAVIGAGSISVSATSGSSIQSDAFESLSKDNNSDIKEENSETKYEDDAHSDLENVSDETDKTANEPNTSDEFEKPSDDTDVDKTTSEDDSMEDSSKESAANEGSSDVGTSDENASSQDEGNEAQNTDAQDADAQDAEARDTETGNSETEDTEAQYTDTQDAETQDSEAASEESEAAEGMDDALETDVISAPDAKNSGSESFRPELSAKAKLTHGSNSGGTGTLNLYIDKLEFLTDARSYNHDISIFSCGLSAMAYSNYSSNRQCLIDLGYDDVNYYRDTNGKTATFWICKTKLSEEDAILVTVVVRGTDSNEWYDNFDVGTDVFHEGFERGAQSVLSTLKSYMDLNDLWGKDVKLLLTGHSRGAGVANLVGYHIDNGELDSQFGRSNTFVYTFATPNLTRIDKADRTEGYNNIYNIVNPEDFVTKLVPYAWGYGRFGITYTLLSKSSTPGKKYKPYLQLLKNSVGMCYESGYSNLYEPYENGIADVEDYVNGLTSIVGSIEGYTKTGYVTGTAGTSYVIRSLHDIYYDTLAAYMAGNESDATSKLLSASAGGMGKLGKITADFFIYYQGTTRSFENAHKPETYFGAMSVIAEDVLKEFKGTYKGIINCPVDVIIYDEDGNIVAQIINNEVSVKQYDIDISVNGDSRSFTLPSCSNYRILLIGNGEGTMDYSIDLYDSDSFMGGRIFYNDIQISRGMEYSMELLEGQNLNSCELVDESGNNVGKQLIPEDEMKSLKVEVVVEGNGQADGYLNLSQGDYVVLYAEAAEGSEFVGWYDEADNMISAETTYGFSIDKNERFIARFKEAPISPSDGGNADNKIDVGTEFTVNGKVFKVTGESTVSIVGITNKNAKSLSIPSSAEYKEQSFTVNEVGSKAFKGLKKLQKVTIPSTVTKIGSKAFYNCSKLKKVTLNANKSLTVGKSAFKKVHSDCCIKVKGLKKKDKKKVVDKVKKQTNGSVK